MTDAITNEKKYEGVNTLSNSNWDPGDHDLNYHYIFGDLVN